MIWLVILWPNILSTHSEYYPFWLRLLLKGDSLRFMCWFVVFYLRWRASCSCLVLIGCDRGHGPFSSCYRSGLLTCFFIFIYIKWKVCIFFFVGRLELRVWTINNMFHVLLLLLLLFLSIVLKLAWNGLILLELKGEMMNI